MNKKRTLTAAMACLVLGLVPAARADIIDNYNFGPGATEFTPTINVSQVPLTYGTAYGDVDAISFSITETVNGTFTVGNSSGTTQRVTNVQYDGNITATAPDGGVVLNVADAFQTVIGGAHTLANGYTSTITITGPMGTTAASYVGGNDTFAFSGTTTKDANNDSPLTTSTSSTITGEQLIEEFLGSGTAPVSVDALSQISATTSGNIYSTSSIDVSGVFTIDYEVVPEPGTWMNVALLFSVVAAGTGRVLIRTRSQS